MLTLEQVKLLETKVAQTVDYIERLAGENAAMRKKLDTNQKRIDELELLVTRFKDEQGRIEDGILSALDRLCQFEQAIEKSLASKDKEVKPAAQDKPARTRNSEPAKPAPLAETTVIPEKKQAESVVADIQDPLAEDTAECDGDTDDQINSKSSDKNGELDIF
jgi:chromosome segregation ATPase